MAEKRPYQYHEEISGFHYAVLEQAAESFHMEFPEFRGLTAFGSMARREMSPDSDADIYAFVEPSPESEIQKAYWQKGAEIFKQVPNGEKLQGTVAFNSNIELDYKILMGETLQRAGVEKTDILLLPISFDIISDQIDTVLDAALEYDNSPGRTDAVAPRNLRGLFHSPVDIQQLHKYQMQVVAGFANSPHGETAWAMVRHMVIGFEEGREHTGTGGHREIPETLEDAKAFYL